MMHPIKKLNGNDLSKIRELEKKLNCCIIAIETLPKTASLSAVELRELQSLEKDTDAVMVAYKC